MRITILVLIFIRCGYVLCPRKQGDTVIAIPRDTTICLQPMTGGFDGFLVGEMRKQEVLVRIIAVVQNPVDPNKPEACDPSKSFLETLPMGFGGAD